MFIGHSNGSSLKYGVNDIKGALKKNLFFNFAPISLKIWHCMQNLKKKTICVVFLKIGPQLFEIFSFLCAKKKNFPYFYYNFRHGIQNGGEVPPLK